MIFIILFIFRTTEWIVGWRLHIVLTVVYLHILQVFIVTYFYLKLAFRVKFHYHWSFGYFTTLLSTLLLIYFTAFLIIGYWFASVDWIDCYGAFSILKKRILILPGFKFFFSKFLGLFERWSIGHHTIYVDRLFVDYIESEFDFGARIFETVAKTRLVDFGCSL